MADGMSPMSQREAILAGIRGSLRVAGGAALSSEEIAPEYQAIARTYAQRSAMGRHELLELFADRLIEYDAGVYRVAADAVTATIAEVLAQRQRGKRGLAVPAGVPVEWLPEGFVFSEADRYSAEQLDKVEGILSGCTVAIAETGSIVLQNAPAQGPRKLSLVPDYHLCVVFASQVVATVPEAFARLEATAALPTTFISGPSATADIEMTRIKGVHGPRFFDVVLVED